MIEWLLGAWLGGAVMSASTCLFNVKTGLLRREQLAGSLLVACVWPVGIVGMGVMLARNAETVKVQHMPTCPDCGELQGRPCECFEWCDDCVAWHLRDDVDEHDDHAVH